MVHRHDKYGLHRQSGKYKTFLIPCQSIFNMVFIHIFFFPCLSEKKKNKRKGKKGGKKKGKEGGKKVKSRDKIIEFPLWRSVLQGRGVAKCDPDHDQGFVLITILVFLT